MNPYQRPTSGRLTIKLVVTIESTVASLEAADMIQRMPRHRLLRESLDYVTDIYTMSDSFVPDEARGTLSD